MKKSIFTLIFTILISTITNAQVFQDFESGSRNTERLNCWQFWSTTVHKSRAINGTYSMRTGQLSNQNNPHRFHTPWIDMVAGNITFKTSLTGLNNNQPRYLTVALIDEANNVTPVLNEYQYTTANVTEISIPVDVTGYYQVAFFWTGRGGNSRAMMDDLSIPGSYAADPSINPNNVGQCPIFQASADADNDGVDDENDEYPNDPTKAYNNYSTGNPANFNTLAYEDLWPAQGDYDFNDLVVDYQYNEITNANNDIVEIQATFYVKAVGGSYDNGFAVQFDNLSPSDIASVTGQRISGSLFSMSNNGTEAGQSRAVIPVFDSAEKVINRVGGSMFNTIPTNGRGSSDAINLVITLSNPKASVGSAPYNPFLIKNQRRGVEIHLADKNPTDLVDASLFGTGQDDSQYQQGRTYKTQNNLPWALDLSSSFNYPVEGESIRDAYLNFSDWARTSGSSFADWFTNTGAGYRNTSKIFNRSN